MVSSPPVMTIGRWHATQRVSTRLYCFQEGRVSLQGESGALSSEQISQAYFGMEAVA